MTTFSRYRTGMVLWLLLCLPGAFALAQETGAGQGAAVSSGSPTVHPITKAAVNAGALACPARINQVMSFLSVGTAKMGYKIYVPPAAPDRGVVAISLELQGKGTPLSYAGTCFAPNQANGCGAMYETVTYWDQKCELVALQHFKGLKRLGVLCKEIVVLDGGPELKVYLMPAGSGCVSIKHEIVR